MWREFPQNQDLWDISANAINFYGLFATHSFTNFNVVYDILLAVKIRSKVNYFGMLHRGLFLEAKLPFLTPQCQN